MVDTQDQRSASQRLRHGGEDGRAVPSQELIGCHWNEWLEDLRPLGIPVGRGQQFRIGGRTPSGSRAATATSRLRA
jgi:hypothetical protein